jgi:hypothetical protein
VEQISFSATAGTWRVYDGTAREKRMCFMQRHRNGFAAIRNALQLLLFTFATFAAVKIFTGKRFNNIIRFVVRKMAHEIYKGHYGNVYDFNEGAFGSPL